MHAQNAQITLKLIDRVQVQADDMTLQAVAQVKAWLKAIHRGELVVGAPIPEPKPALPGKAKK